MALDVQKYKANFFLIAGLAIMTPFAKLITGILTPAELIALNLRYIIIFFVSGLLFLGGIIFIIKGGEHLEL